MSPFSRSDRLRLATLVVAALALRVALVLVPTFWANEVAVVARAALPIPRFLLAALHDGQPPVFPVLVHLAMRLAQCCSFGGELPLLRLTSLLAGMATLLMAVEAARRWWGGAAAVLTALFFACLPPMLLASATLSATAVLQMAILAATLIWIRLGEPGGRLSTRLILALDYLILMTLALGCSPWAAAMLPMHLLLIVADRKVFPATTRPARWRLCLALGVLAGQAPWWWWLTRLAARRAPGREPAFAAFLRFWTPPVADAVPPSVPSDPSALGLATIGAVVALLLLAVAVGRLRAMARAWKTESGAPDRPFVALALATVLPMAAWLLPFARDVVERSPLPALVLPFGLMFAARLLSAPGGLSFRLAARLRVGLALLLIPCALWVVFAWPNGRSAAGMMDALPEVDLPLATDTIAWTNERVAPWLRRAGAFTLVEPEAALRRPSDDFSRPVWFVSHRDASRPASLLSPDADILTQALNNTPGVMRVPIPPRWSQWDRVWVVSPQILPAVAGRWADGRARRADQARPVPGGQVLLPDDPAIQFGQGWAVPECTDDLKLFYCWSLGDSQRIDWHGPERPGRYRLRLFFWRPKPLPSLACRIAYRLPDMDSWRKLDVSNTGALTIEGTIRVQAPRQPLRVKLRIPSWIPWRYLPGSTDARPLGIQLTRVELTPLD
jgi:hypothetical protein